jgi:hypothetical protein
MVKPVSGDGKAEVLAGSRTLNPHPGAVTDAVFEGEDFFDPRDLVQVKYEMVRKTDVRTSRWPWLRLLSGSPDSRCIRPRQRCASRAWRGWSRPGLAPRPGTS